jgi:hypothetical protein
MSEEQKRIDRMPERRVLVFPAGTEIGLEIHAALRDCRNMKLFAAGEDVSNHARFLYPEYHAIPNVHSDGWLEILVSVCQRLGIHYIFPAHDDVVVALSTMRDQIPATIVTSNRKACLVTRSKSDTYHCLANAVPVPRLFASGSEVVEFPVLVKPDKGQGSSHITRVDTHEQLESALASVPEGIISEYLPGKEYTVDCFSSRTQGLLFAGARSRRRTRNGISVNTATEDLPEAWSMAEAIHNALGLRGAWFFQLKRNSKGDPVLLEVAPRIAGAMAAHRVTGINFPLLSIMELEGTSLRIAPIKMRVELDRALCNRYSHDLRFQALYVDLDDTLLCGSGVNLQVIQLVFRCLNEGKHVALITRHRADLEQTLQRFRIAGIFDEIIHLRNGEKKSDHITRTDAVFVDDSFSERQEVAIKHGIPTFDSSMIEVLCEQRPSPTIGPVAR